MPLDGEQFSFLEKVINLVEKHGLVRIFKAIFVITAFFFVMYNGHKVIGTTPHKAGIRC